MTREEHIQEHIDNDSEMIHRLTCFIAEALPHCAGDLAVVHSIWNKNREDIDREYRETPDE